MRVYIGQNMLKLIGFSFIGQHRSIFRIWEREIYVSAEYVSKAQNRKRQHNHFSSHLEM